MSVDETTKRKLLEVDFSVEHRIVGRQTFAITKNFLSRDGGRTHKLTVLTSREDDHHIVFKEEGTQLVRWRVSGGTYDYDMTDHSARRLWDGLQQVGFEVDSYA